MSNCLRETEEETVTNEMICPLVLIALVGTVVALPVGDEFNAEALRQLSLGKANDDFGLNLLNQLELDERQVRGAKHEEAKNILISPFSVSTVLSMVLAGANNVTHDQIFKTLGFNPTNFKTDAEIFSSYKTLFSNIRSTFSSDKKNELQVANSIALQKNFKILQSYLDTVTNNFDSKIFAEDFLTKSHESTADINKWVAEKTNGKIEKLFNNDLDANTVMVLLNAIYFKGTWKTRFEKEKTVAAQFHVDPEKSVTTQTMNVRGQFRFGAFEDGQLVELPYNDALSMLIYLPDQTSAKNFKSISSQFGRSVEHGSLKLAERLATLRSEQVEVRLPKFKIESDFSLKTTLNSLGITNAFSTSADFSRINGAKDLYLSAVVHKTFLEVNEEGSEAAAATGGVINVRAMPHHIEFNVDRPFLFLIRDNMHQLTLFTGVVNKP